MMNACLILLLVYAGDVLFCRLVAPWEIQRQFGDCPGGLIGRYIFDVCVIIFAIATLVSLNTGHLRY